MCIFRKMMTKRYPIVDFLSKKRVCYICLHQKKHDKMAKKALQLGNAITAGGNPCSNGKTPRTVKRYYQEKQVLFFATLLHAESNGKRC